MEVQETLFAATQVPATLPLASACDVQCAARAEIDARPVNANNKEARRVPWMVTVQSTLEVRNSGPRFCRLSCRNYRIIDVEQRGQVIMVGSIEHTIPVGIAREHGLEMLDGVAFL